MSLPLGSNVKTHPTRSHASVKLRGRGGLPDSTPILPNGAFGIWYFDQAQTSPRLAVPNTVSSNPLSSNLISAPRRLFARGEYFSQNNCTVTDNFANGPDGKQYASRVVATSTWSFTHSPGGSGFSAGTYTMVIDVKSNTGSSQTFRMGTSSLVRQTATTSWQSFPVTVVNPGASIIYIVEFDDLDNTSRDILIDNCRIYSGGSDLGAQILDTHIYFGKDQPDTRPVIATGGVDMSTSGALLLTQFDPAISVDPFTLFSVTRKLSKGPTFEPLITDLTGVTNFAAQHDTGNLCNFYLGGSTVLSHQFDSNHDEKIQSPDLLWYPIDTAFQVRAFKYDGVKGSMWLNGIKYYETAVSGRTANAVKELWNCYNDTSFFSKAIYNTLVLYTSALSDSQVESGCRYLKQRSVTAGFPTGMSRFFCADGDSITNGNAASNLTPYPYLFQPNSSPFSYGINRSIGGTCLQGNVAVPGLNIRDRQASVNALIPTFKEGRIFTYTLLIGRNDFGIASVAANPAQFAADVGTFMLEQKNAKWDRTVLCTLLPSTGTGFNAWRNIVNGIWNGVGWAASYGITAICDFASDPTIGPDAAASDTSLYSDGTHPTNACYAIAEPIYRARLNA